MAYLTDSDTIKIVGIGPYTNTDTRMVQPQRIHNLSNFHRSF